MKIILVITLTILSTKINAGTLTVFYDGSVWQDFGCDLVYNESAIETDIWDLEEVFDKKIKNVYHINCPSLPPESYKSSNQNTVIKINGNRLACRLKTFRQVPTDWILEVFCYPKDDIFSNGFD